MFPVFPTFILPYKIGFRIIFFIVSAILFYFTLEKLVDIPGFFTFWGNLELKERWKFYWTVLFFFLAAYLLILAIFSLRKGGYLKFSSVVIFIAMSIGVFILTPIAILVSLRIMVLLCLVLLIAEAVLYFISYDEMSEKN